MNLPLLWFSKSASYASKQLGFGAGGTWPGHIMMEVTPSFLKNFGKKFKGKIVVVAGTNGKTTTSLMIRKIVEADNKKFIHNDTGANLLNGIASSVVKHADLMGNHDHDVAIFETDENNLPLLLKELTPDILVVLNIFRDQLDRYGEVETIASRWKESIDKLSEKTTLVLNANDPYVSFLAKGTKAKAVYFGLDDKKLFLGKRPFAMDASYCPNCSAPLEFDGFYFAHLGNWKCSKCKFSMPVIDISPKPSSLPGMYNIYNTNAALQVCKILGIEKQVVDQALDSFLPAFGRQEEFTIKDKHIKIFLSKNPAGFTESIRTAKGLGGKYFLIALNDNPVDGRDVSWIWDVDFELVGDETFVIATGLRAYDLGVRLKYAFVEKEDGIVINASAYKVIPKLTTAITKALEETPKEETLFVLATYSAMLEVREILTGRKIL